MSSSEQDARLAELARELYEADALHNQRLVAFPLEHWEEADEPTRARWMNVARTALAFCAKA